jgi:hypothetical protein
MKKKNVFITHQASRGVYVFTTQGLATALFIVFLILWLG